MRLVGNAYLAKGDETSLPAVHALLREHGIEANGNPDVYTRTYALLGIDEARELRERAYGKAMQGTARVFVIVFNATTNEAQNALLKTLEEPPAGSLFILVTTAPDMLLPTIRSRVQQLSFATQEQGVLSASDFLRAQPRARLEMLKPLLEKGDDERRDIGSIIAFLGSLERALAHEKDAREGIEAVYRARAYVGDRGSLVKPLLEHVALLAPVIGR